MKPNNKTRVFIEQRVDQRKRKIILNRLRGST